IICHVLHSDRQQFPTRSGPKLTNVKLALREADFNPDFLRGFLPRSNGMRSSRHPDNIHRIGDTSLPVERSGMLDDDLLEIVAPRRVLLEIHIRRGFYGVSNCGHVYPISNGIPDVVGLHLARSQALFDYSSSICR
ncbi:hypothetical protein V8E52_006934, partial [Russula decolorans]